MWLPRSVQEAGHVSLETENYYISLWPEKEKSKCLDIQKGVFLSYRQDYSNADGKPNLGEKRFANKEYLLQIPNIKKLENYASRCLKTAKSRRGVSWTLLGHNCTPTDNTTNCSGLVHKLLIEGGFEQLIPPMRPNVEDTKPACREFLERANGCVNLAILISSIGSMVAFFSNGFGSKESKGFKVATGLFFTVAALLFALLIKFLVLYLITTVCLAPMGRTLSGRGIIVTPQGINKLMEMAVSKNFAEERSLDPNNRRIFKGNDDAINFVSSDEPLQDLSRSFV